MLITIHEVLIWVNLKWSPFPKLGPENPCQCVGDDNPRGDRWLILQPLSGEERIVEGRPSCHRQVGSLARKHVFKQTQWTHFCFSLVTFPLCSVLEVPLRFLMLTTFFSSCRGWTLSLLGWCSTLQPRLCCFYVLSFSSGLSRFGLHHHVLRLPGPQAGNPQIPIGLYFWTAGSSQLWGVETISSLHSSEWNHGAPERTCVKFRFYWCLQVIIGISGTDCEVVKLP